MPTTSRLPLLQSWVHHLLDFSISIAQALLVAFELMLAGGSRRGAPAYGRPLRMNRDTLEPRLDSRFTAADRAWLASRRRGERPPGLFAKLTDSVGCAWTMGVFGGLLMYEEDGALEGPWLQRGFPFVV